MEHQILDKFKLEENGRRICSPVIDLTVYTNQPFSECPEGVLNFYNEFMDHFGAKVGWYSTEKMTDEKEITPKVDTMVPTWFRGDTAERMDYGLYLHSGTQDDDHRPPAFHMFSTRLGHTANFLRMMAPVDMDILERDGAEFVNLVKRAIDDVPFMSGHAGYAVYYNHKSQGDKTRAGNLTGPLLMRYPGVDIGMPMNTAIRVKDAVKGVNWLTMLNNDYCSRLGGVEQVRSALDLENIEIHVVDNGIIIQAGAEPETGDLNRGETLPAYRAVSRVVQPLRLTKHDQIHGMSIEQTERWFQRFDD